MSEGQLRAAVEAFLFREARLLDAGDFAGWLDLFAEDGCYWVPLAPDQADPLGTASIMYEDRAVLEMRVARLAHPRAYAVDPPPRTTHLVGNVALLETAGDAVAVGSALVMTEVRAGSNVSATTVYSGRVRHKLRRAGDEFEIVLKRVDLDQAGSVHGIITVPF